MLLSCRFEVAVLCASFLVVRMPLRSQNTDATSTPTFKTLVNFDQTNGQEPGALIQGTDGNFYGATQFGGAHNANICSASGNSGCGTLFKITSKGLTTLYSFCAKTNCADGFEPYAGLVQGTDGNFYGTTVGGGTSTSCNGGCGIVFKITPSGQLATIHNFAGADGAGPAGTLVQAADGNFYGTTQAGGSSPSCKNGCGTVFRITPEGTLTTLHSFDFSDGAAPFAGLVLASDGNFYGTTGAGANQTCNYDTPTGCGTVFKITPSGQLATLHKFGGTDGANPVGTLVQVNSGTFYGTTGLGGLNDCSGFPGCGTIFSITSAGKLSTVHKFDFTDGGVPPAGLVLASDGNFYGITYISKTPNIFFGTVFEMASNGKLTTLHTFDGKDGAAPYAALVQGTDGNFYGSTLGGGANDNDGTIFMLGVGLGPFVETRPTSAAVGALVEILGNNLTGATSVTFNGAAAKFKVVSGSEITATVPTSATTGKVEVKTPSGVLLSNIVFRVTPSVSSFSPTSGPAGTSVIMSGEALSGATSVTFGGVKGTAFTVDSYTKITADVPKGAKTGKISVTTLGGTATSTEIFTVN